jgi:DNA-binding NtrC family response regulator
MVNIQHCFSLTFSARELAFSEQHCGFEYAGSHERILDRRPFDPDPLRGTAMNTQPNVVVIDDDVAVLSAIEDILKAKTNFLVRTFRTYREAIEMLEAERVDVIVTDIILDAEATGIDVCVAAIERHPHVALVLISAESVLDYSGYPLRTVCLQKPFSATELLDAIARAQETSTLTEQG